MTTTLAVRPRAEEELAAILAGDVPALPATSLRQLVATCSRSRGKRVCPLLDAIEEDNELEQIQL